MLEVARHINYISSPLVDTIPIMASAKQLEHDKALMTLQNEKSGLFHRLLNFARDLQRGPDQPGPGERLEAAIQDPYMRYYFSSVHFAQDEITYLMDFPGPDGLSFCNILEQKFQDARSEICTSHTLLPIIMGFFHIPMDYSKSKAFEKRYKVFEKQWRKSGQTESRP